MILLALTFILIDIPLANGLDIIPDAVGYLILGIVFFTAFRRREKPIWWAIISLISAAFSVYSYFDTSLLAVRILRFFLLIAATFLICYQSFLLVCKRAREKVHPLSQDEFKAAKSLVLSGLFLIVACELSAPIAALIGDILRYVLLILINFAAILVIVMVAKIAKLRQY